MMQSGPTVKVKFSDLCLISSHLDLPCILRLESPLIVSLTTSGRGLQGQMTFFKSSKLYARIVAGEFDFYKCLHSEHFSSQKSCHMQEWGIQRKYMVKSPAIPA